jgi:hypothetical protein
MLSDIIFNFYYNFELVLEFSGPDVHDVTSFSEQNCTDKCTTIEKRKEKKKDNHTPPEHNLTSFYSGIVHSKYLSRHHSNHGS